jgi:hypothetical protein
MAPVRTDVSEERIASIMMVTRISELGTTLAVLLCCALLLLVTPNVVPSSPIISLMMEAICSSEMSVLTRVILNNIQEDGILHSHRRENRKSYKDKNDSGFNKVKFTCQNLRFSRR